MEVTIMTTPSDAFVRRADALAANPVPGADETAMQVLIGDDRAPNFAMRRFIMQPGGGMPPHTNTVEHEQYVLVGSARIGLGEQVVDVSVGDVVFIPPGVVHWYRAGAQGFQFLCLVPNRVDAVEIVGTC